MKIAEIKLRIEEIGSVMEEKSDILAEPNHWQLYREGRGCLNRAACYLGYPNDEIFNLEQALGELERAVVYLERELMICYELRYFCDRIWSEISLMEYCFGEEEK
jgi:hypothetical protein